MDKDLIRKDATMYAKTKPACYSVCPTSCIRWGETTSLTERIVQEAMSQKMK